jgi:hypothetical protein
MLNKTTNINATLAIQPNRNVNAEAIKLAAEKRIEAELLAFNGAFYKSTTRIS